MNGVVNIIAEGRPNRPGIAMLPRWISIHDTDNENEGADAIAHGNMLQTTADVKSWHYTVDDVRWVKHLPLSEHGWHAGDGADGPGNRTSIGIEICMNKDGNRVTAEMNAAELVAHLLIAHGLGIDRVCQHNKWSGKNCPSVIRARSRGWEGFISMVEWHLGYMRAKEKLATIADTLKT